MKTIKFEYNWEICTTNTYSDNNEKILILDDRNKQNTTSLTNMLWYCNLEEELRKIYIDLDKYNIYLINIDYPDYVEHMFSELEDINWKSFDSIRNFSLDKKLRKIIETNN